MTFCLTMAVAMTVTAGALFLRHRRRTPDLLKPTTLFGVYRDLFGDMPSRLDGGQLILFGAAVAGVFATLFPMILVALLRYRVVEASRGGIVFVLLGLLCGAGAVGNFIVIILAHISFAFGGSAMPKSVSRFAWALGYLHAALGLGSLLIGVSSACASVAARLVN